MKLLSFRVENYKSFNEEQGVSFNFDEHNANAIFGPNGSGKTNFFDALDFFKHFILYSTRFLDPETFYRPFALKIRNEQKPMRFAAEFSDSEMLFSYTFAINQEGVQDEVLKAGFLDSRQKPLNTIFSRKSIRNGAYEENGFTKELLKTTRDDSLVLTRAFEVNNKIATRIFHFFARLKLISRDQFVSQTVSKIIDNPEYKQKVLEFLKSSDLFIQDLSVDRYLTTRKGVIGIVPGQEEELQSVSRMNYQAMTTHYVRDESGAVVTTNQFDLASQESTGTKRIFALACPILEALESGSVLYIDEFETALHPQECRFLVSLFNSKNNPKNAQLIINTHCSTIMDQLGYKNCFLFGKNQFEETIIGNIPGEARNVALEKKYNRGDFGAVPRVEVIE